MRFFSSLVKIVGDGKVMENKSLKGLKCWSQRRLSFQNYFKTLLEKRNMHHLPY